MANYQTIFYVREAQQLDIEDITNPPLAIIVSSGNYPIYRDNSGFYIIVQTTLGQQRAYQDQWIVLMAAGIPGIPSIPEIKATGSYTVSGVAAGDGTVGFSYNTVPYTVSPIGTATSDNTASDLGLLINQGFGLIANVVGSVITLTSQLSGVSGDLAAVDVSTDSVQSGVPVGLSGGQDFVPATPEVPAIFQVYNDGDFQLVYEPEV